ncbi:MAG: hypothetical protein RLZ12_655 [Bacillota bacterium]
MSQNNAQQSQDAPLVQTTPMERGGTKIYMWGKLSFPYHDITDLTAIELQEPNYHRIIKVVSTSDDNYALLTNNHIYSWRYPNPPGVIFITRDFGPIKNISTTDKALYTLFDNNIIWIYTDHWYQFTGITPPKTINFINPLFDTSVLAVCNDGSLYLMSQKYILKLPFEHVVDIATFIHTVVITVADGSVFTFDIWGGHFGDSYYVRKDDIKAIVGLPPIKKVFTNHTAFYGIDDIGHLWSWGTNKDGYLGTGADLDTEHPPTEISFPNGGRVKDLSITTYGQQIMALLDDHKTLFTWGKNLFRTASVEPAYFNTPTAVFFPPTLPGQDSQIIGSIFAGSHYFGAVTTMSYLTPWL